jgi:hypothetical protein
MRIPRASRGSTLLITTILLLVLTAAGVAAISITGLDRQNASIQSRYQKLVECGSAAQALIWAQLARYGTTYIGSTMPIGKIQLPDGTQLAAPIHYGQDATTALANVSYTVQSGGGGQGTADIDCTNRLCGQTNSGNPVLIVARCTDAHNRQYEVELSFAFAL